MQRLSGSLSRVAVAAVLALLALSLFPAQANAETTTQRTGNYAGWGASGKPGGWQTASGDWTVPLITCEGPNAFASRAAPWVGLTGLTPGSFLVQTGTVSQ